MMQATKNNYATLCEIAYNLTGNVYWLHKPQFDAQSGANFFTEFHSVKKQIKVLIDSGSIYQYPMFYLSTMQPKPYIGNSVNIL